MHSYSLVAWTLVINNFTFYVFCYISFCQMCVVVGTYQCIHVATLYTDTFCEPKMCPTEPNPNKRVRFPSLQWCIPRGNCLASRHLEAVFLLPRPRLVLDNCSSNLPRDENFNFKNFFDRPTRNSLHTYLVVVWVSSYWLLITWSIMDCVLWFIATICISYALFTNFVRYCCLASASKKLRRVHHCISVVCPMVL